MTLSYYKNTAISNEVQLGVGGGGGSLSFPHPIAKINDFFVIKVISRFSDLNTLYLINILP